MRRSGSWIVGLSLLAIPLSAQPTPASGAAASGPSSTSAFWERAGARQPLAPDQRLFYGLAGLSGEALEVQFLVNAKVYVTETLDLAAVRPRQIDAGNPRSIPESARALEFPRRLDGERITQLLAGRPDLARKLHQLAQNGVRVDLSLYQHGRLLETFSFTELLRRSAALRRSGGIPMAVPSVVVGPEDGADSERPLFAATYLENCGDCTQTTPCETECGWDEGKGGPVTCGEHGVCQSDPCYWELVQNLGWCDTDFDTHFGYYSVEIFGERRYRHTCTEATCYDKYQIDESYCPIGPGSCNSSASGCCECAYGEPLCGASPGCRNDCPF